MYGIIYMTTCLVDGQRYIGQHKCKRDNDRYLGSGALLKKAIKEFGASSFVRETLCVCESEEELNQKEIEYIAKYNATKDPDFYNICEGGKSNRFPGELNPMYGRRGPLAPAYGKHHSPEWIQQMRERMTGERNPMYGRKYTLEERMKFGHPGESHWNYGQHWSDEVKTKISSGNKGKQCWNKGLKLSDEHRRHLSEAKKGIIPNYTEEERERRRQLCIERNSTEKFKKQVSESNKRFHESGGRRGAKPVVCVETGVVYASGYDACRAIGCSNGLIGACLCGAQKTAKGFHWRYATPEETQEKMVYVA